MEEGKLFNNQAYRNRIPNVSLLVFASFALKEMIQDLGLLNRPEAWLLSYPLSASIVYWVPPKPNEKYLIWILRWSLLAIGFYLTFYKIPDVLPCWVPL